MSSQTPKQINNRNQLSYNKIAKIYAGDIPREDDPQMRSKCRDLFCNRLPGKKILEVGCGPGTDAIAFHNMGLSITATDYSEEFVSIVRNRYPQLQVQQMDMTISPIDERYHGIYSFASFLHIPRQLALTTLKNLYSLLEPQGIVFLHLIQSSKHREYTISNWGGENNNPMLFVCYSPKEIEQILVMAGFSKCDFYYINSPVYQNMPRLIERGVSGYQVIAQ